MAIVHLFLHFSLDLRESLRAEIFHAESQVPRKQNHVSVICVHIIQRDEETHERIMLFIILISSASSTAWTD